MAWVVPALITAGIAAGAAGLAHDIKGFVQGKTPWDDPKEWTLGALKEGAMGFAGGFIGGAIGPALGAAGEALGLSQAGTTAAQSGAVVPATTSDVIAPATSHILNSGVNATESSLGSTLANVGKDALVNAGVGAARDYQHPLRGALVGAAGGVAARGLSFAGQSTGILPSAPQANFQPAGDLGYSADSASVMPPSPGYTSSGFGPSLGSRAMANAGQFGVKAGSMATRQAVGNAMTPPPPQQPMGTYQSFGIQPYFERKPYA